MSSNLSDTWAEFLEELDNVRRVLEGSRAQTVNSQPARRQVRELVQSYFRQARPELLDSGIKEKELQTMDSAMQQLLRLANGRNSRTAYLRYLNGARRVGADLDIEREIRFGSLSRGRGQMVRPDIEGRIIFTLTNLLPSAALSYQQALDDLADGDRVSFRGTANELREVVREVLDRLAPDQDLASIGARPEGPESTFTHRQKARHILRSRQLPENAREAPERAVTIIEELTASLTRATYVRGAIASHVASARAEVSQLKMYVDVVLAELLELHR